MRKFYFLILFFIVWSNVWSQNLPSHLYASENTTIVYEGIHGSKRMSEDGKLGNLDVGYQGIYGVPVEGQVLLKFKLPVVPEGYEVETALLYFPIKGGVIQGAASFSLKASSSLNHNWTQNEVSNATLPTPIAGSTIARSVAMNAPTTKPVIGPYDFTSYVSNEIYKSNPHATFIFSAFSAEQAEAAKILHNEHYVKTTETHLGGTERPYLVITYTEVTEIEITGVTNGSFYRNNVTPHFNVGTATLNGAPYTLGTTITNEGTYTLTVTNGNKIQTVQFTIDKTRPTANIVINNGSSFTNHEYVDVRITPDLGVNDIVSMRYSVNESPVSTTQAYQSQFSVGIGSENGEKSVRVELIDAAGNISPLYSWDFALNTTIPTGNLTINNGALYTTDRAVNLLIVPTAGSNEIVSMRFSNDNIYWSSLESYNPRKTYTLSSGDGNKTVYVQLLDRFGNVGVLQSSIFLDMTPPKASVLINNGGQYTNNTNVAIEITPDIGVNDITYIRYTINGLPPTTIAYTNSFGINVGSTNGEKEITITLFDAAWHSSTIYSATVTLDTLPPTATITTSKTSLKIGDVSTVTITFSEAVTGFDDGDLKAENGTLSGVLSTDGGITWTVTFTPDPGITNTTNVITLDNTGVTDLAGNSGVATTDSNNYAIDTQQPNSPSNFQAIGKDRKVELSWDKNQETDFKQYNLYKIIDSVKSLLSTLPKGRLSYIDPNLTNGETYNYVLVAEDNIGNLSSETTISAKAIGEQKISFSPLSDIDYGDIISLGATASSELEVSYSSSDSTIAEVYQDINDQNKWKLKAKKVGLAVVITANQSGASNYLPAISISQNININVAQLKVTANAQNKVYGTLDPSLTFAVTGFKNNDQEANVLSGSLVRDTGENVGAYVIGKGSLVASSNYKIDFETDSLTITKASLSGITFNSSSFVYDGTSKIIEISGNLPKGASVTYTGNNQTETGVHQVIATIDGGTNYVGQILNADLTITKASLSGITFNSSSFVYDGTSKIIEISGNLPKGVSVSYAGNNQTETGVHQVIATIDGGTNYVGQTLNADLTITKALLSGITFNSSSFVYDGTSKLILISGNLPKGASVSYAGNNQTETGVHQVIATIDGGTNHVGQTLNADLTITKASLSGITFNSSSFVYDGTSKSILISGNLPKGTSVTYTGNNQTETGVHQVIATIDGGTNYVGQTLNADLTITKASLSGITFNSSSFVYDGTSKIIEISGNLPKGASVSYAGNNQTETGVHQVIATIDGGTNYIGQTLNADLTITKASLSGITFNSSSFVYDGTSKIIEISGNLPKGASVSYTGNNQTEAGVHQVIATIDGGTNYVGQTLNADLTITKASLSGITFNSSSFVYDGTSKSILISGNLPKGTSVTYAGNNQTETGVHQVIATIDGGTNYIGQTLNADLIITKASLSGITFNSSSFVYDGTSKIIEISGNLPKGASVSYAGNNQTETGVHQVIATIDGGTNYIGQTLNADLTITKASLSGITFNSSSFVYDGTSKIIEISGNLPKGASVSYTGNNQTEAGVHQVIATIDGGTNYVGQTLNADLTITKASQSIVWDQNLIIGCSNETTIQLTARSSSGLPIMYKSSNESIAEINGAEVILIGNGYVEITAFQLGNNNFLSSNQITQTLNHKLNGMIKQKWDNILIFDNNSNDFEKWQWYKNGTIISGAIGQYYQSPQALSGIYHVIATDKSGNKMETCPISIVANQHKGGVKVVPNPVRQGEMFNIVADYSVEELKGASLVVMDLTGKIYKEITNVESTTKLKAPLTASVYIVHLFLKDGRKASTKMLVN